MKDFTHNTFRPNDASEYVDAYRSGLTLPLDKLPAKLAELSARMGSDPPSYLLAAYRGYEDAWMFKSKGTLPGVVKLDDTDPTRCEVMTPQGYQHR